MTVVEHGSSRAGRWLHGHRARLALWVAVAEVALVLFGVIPKWPAFFVGLALIAFYALVGRNLRSYTLRQASWVAAFSQLAIVALPFLIGLLTLAAFVALGILLLVAIAYLFVRRR